MRTMLRIVISAAILVGGGILIYEFGAGYFSLYGFGLPSPWNVVAVVIMGTGLVLVVGWLLSFRRRSRRT